MTFGVLKGRFQCLHRLRVKPDRACDITVACSVLHNIAVLRKERAPTPEVDRDWDDIPHAFPDNPEGTVVRERYSHNYFG